VLKQNQSALQEYRFTMISSLTFLLISNTKQIAHPVPCFFMYQYSH